jgi:uncharacterized phage protein gp47/JayE
MFEDKTKDSIHQDMLTNISDEYDKTVGSFIYDSTKPVAIELETVYQDLGSVVDKLSIEKLKDDELAQRVYERTGIERKLATYATATVLVSGTEAAIINTGDKVASDTVNFSCTESKTIDSSGQVLVLVQCDEEGSIGNVPANSIKYFPITLQGLASVTNQSPITNGYDAESDEALLKRYFEHIQTPPTSGNKAQYKNWAKEVTGVGDARVFPLWNGNNTVKIVIIDSNKQAASTDLVANVQEYIDPNISGTGEGEAPIGAYCTVVSAAELEINVSFTAVKDLAYTDQQLQTNVETVINNYLNDIAFVEVQVSYAKIGSLILSVGGILDYSDLQVNSGTVNLIVNDEQVAVLGGVTIA